VILSFTPPVMPTATEKAVIICRRLVGRAVAQYNIVLVITTVRNASWLDNSTVLFENIINASILLSITITGIIQLRAI
jgi:hypothetical protein